MEGKGSRKVTRSGVFLAEKVVIELEGDEEDKFNRDPASYLTEFLKSEGFEVREVKTDGIKMHDEPVPGKGSEGDRWFEYMHILWDRDPAAICMWTPV